LICSADNLHVGDCLTYLEGCEEAVAKPDENAEHT